MTHNLCYLTSKAQRAKPNALKATILSKTQPSANGAAGVAYHVIIQEFAVVVATAFCIKEFARCSARLAFTGVSALPAKLALIHVMIAMILLIASIALVDIFSISPFAFKNAQSISGRLLH